MWKNYAITAIRNFLRQRLNSIINVLGFAIGLASFILIVLYLINELSYDRFWPDHDRIYRVTRLWKNQDGKTSLHLARVAPPAGPLLKQDFSNYLEDVVRVYGGYTTVITFEDKKFLEARFFAAEPEIFNIFPNKFLAGDPKTCLKEPFTVVLTRKTAEKYFGKTDPIGKTLKYQDFGLFRVTAVVENLPLNTHFPYDFLASFSTLVQAFGNQSLITDWGSNNYLTYIKFREKASAAQLESQLDHFIDVHLAPFYKNVTGVPPKFKPSQGTQLVLQKLDDIHLYSNLSTEIVPNGSIRSIYIFATVAFFILLIACINFMNLSTARASTRAREVALRKVLGATRWQLILQFMGESFLMTFITLAISVTAVDLILPTFNNYVFKHLSLLIGTPGLSIIIFFLLLFMVAIIAGSYPSFMLSSFRPLTILKGVRSRGAQGSSFRTTLVISQFTITAVLLISIIFIFRQWKFLANSELGFDKDKVVVFATNDKMHASLNAFRSSLKSNPAILNVGFSDLIPSNDLVNCMDAYIVDGPNPGNLTFMLYMVRIDYDFFKTYGMKVIAGRGFSEEFPSDDSLAFILNEKAVERIGWGKPENAINRPFKYGDRHGQIIGVVKDVHFETLHNEIAPMIYYIDRSNVSVASIKIAGNDLKQTLHHIEDTWNKYSPESVYTYSFLDENYRNLYRPEQQLGEVTGMFALLALVIACLGLFGLASFASTQRTKEIGVRKVMGSELHQIIALLSYSFLRWILLANIIAWPISWYFIHQWLKGFPYKIKLDPFVFLYSILITMGIAFLTILYQTIKAARENPVKALRYE
jgi:putative ABC transport system permease protein